MGRKGKPVAVFKEIDGVRHKRCRGPLHREGKFVPVGEFFLIRSGRFEGMPRAHCKDCESVFRGTERMVPLDQGWINLLDEIVFRVGVMETCRLLERSQNWLWLVRRKRVNSIQRRTARKIVLVLMQLRKENYARHRLSIKHGSSLRGHKERIPVERRDFNGPDSHAAETRRNWSKEHPERDKIAQDRRNAKRRSGSLTEGAITE